MINLICPECGAKGQIARTPGGFRKISGCIHIFAEREFYGFAAEHKEEHLNDLARQVEALNE